MESRIFDTDRTAWYSWTAWYFGIAVSLARKYYREHKSRVDHGGGSWMDGFDAGRVHESLLALHSLQRLACRCLAVRHRLSNN